MKKFKYLIGITIIALISLTSNLNAQDPGNPPGDPSEGDGGGPIGGNAPIGAGITLLLALGAAYGGRKTYLLTRKDKAAI